MRRRKFGLKVLSFNLIWGILCFCATLSIFSQSTEQNSPTPITSNQINGRINARDIGDARLTTYYYIFNGNRGDIFINVLTKNFNGDLDVFTLDGLKPRTKITVYADSSENETGRVIYMRKPEKLLLRIQGRTPNDDPADYQVKFAGSFAPSEALAASDDLKRPEAESAEEGAVRVNSVGTIIEEPEPDRKAEDLNVDIRKDALADSADKSKPKDKPKREVPSTLDPTKKTETVLKEATAQNRPRVLIEDPFKDKKAADEDAKDVTVSINDKPKRGSTIVTIERAPVEEEALSPEEAAKKKTAALRKISLVIKLKDGKTFKRRMHRVSSFNVFDGVLKVVAIDGKVTKFSILDVEKITIQ